jgi:hypothetical protein
MPDTPTDAATTDTPEGRDRDDVAEDEPPDESVLLGATGVEEEVLAELARAEGELSDPNAPDDHADDEGAEV